MALSLLGNGADYRSHQAFLQIVLSMDTTFQSPALRGRAITGPALQTAAYLAIIAAEIAGAVLLWWGAARLWRVRAASPEAFHPAKGPALLALMWCFSIWGARFGAIGGDWVAMLQYDTWNGPGSEKRRVGEECVLTGRSPWLPGH